MESLSQLFTYSELLQDYLHTLYNYTIKIQGLEMKLLNV
jgi:hypothetical protein